MIVFEYEKDSNGLYYSQCSFHKIVVSHWGLLRLLCQNICQGSDISSVGSRRLCSVCLYRRMQWFFRAGQWLMSACTVPSEPLDPCRPQRHLPFSNWQLKPKRYFINIHLYPLGQDTFKLDFKYSRCICYRRLAESLQKTLPITIING